MEEVGRGQPGSRAHAVAGASEGRALRHFELRVLGAKRLLPHRLKAHEQLEIVVKLLDRQYRSETKMRMLDADARPQACGHRLVLVRVRVVRLLAHAVAAIAAAW